MKRLLIATALTFAIAAPAVADEPGKEARKAYEEHQREALKDRREAEREYWKDRREAEREYAKDRREAQREYEKERLEEWRERRDDDREWARGGYLPRAYLDDRYYVRDYARYDLAPPTPGYVWVRPGEDAERYYMVQLATGLIAEILGD